MAIFHGTLPFCLWYIFLISSPVVLSVYDSEALLQFRKSLTDTKMIDSWSNAEKPCQINIPRWPGIICTNGRVTHLLLKDMGLSGIVDVDALIGMKSLRIVTVEGNSFNGPIPNFNKLTALKAIYLSRNQFSGEIPQDFFKKMGSLKRVWLDANNFTGNIPSSLASISGLTELHLEFNQFSGQILPLDIASLDEFDVANNYLEGEIPSTLSKFGSESFQGNSGLCGEKIGKKCLVKSASSKPSSGTKHTLATALLGAALGILMIVVVAILLLRRRQKKFNVLEKDGFDGSISSNHHTSRGHSGLSRGGFESAKRTSISRGPGDLVIVNEDKGTFGLSDLMKAGAEVLGTGTLGSSYKATMSNGMTVVVKRIKDMNKLGRDEFDSEIRRLGRLRHPNVLTPLAYHYRKEEKLLVSEYASKGNLLYLLHGDRGPSHVELNWPTRLKIVGGITRGLYYLHTELSSESVPHGNLKSSNVLLVQGFEPLLVDYNFCSFLNSQQAAQAVHAYKTPEAESSYQVSAKSDIYCLGIIILEILTGKSHNNYTNAGKGGIDVVQWVRTCVLDGRENEVLDPEVLDEFNAEEMERLLHVGACCVDRSPEQRPDIREVLRRVEETERECARTHGYGGPMVRDSHLSRVQSRSNEGLESFRSRSQRLNSDNLPYDIS